MAFKKGGAGATKIGKLSKPPMQKKVGGISTPFSNRVMKGMKGMSSR